MFLTEFINTSKDPVKLEAGRVLGYADFSSSEEMERFSWQTDMYNTYKCESSPATNNAGNPENDDELEEIVCDPPPTSNRPESTSEPPQPQDTPPPLNQEIPPGAVPLKIDYSNICKEARKRKKELQNLLEVTHANAFSKHDRDYGKTSVIQFRAHLKDPPGPPIAVPPYRTRPEVREHIDKQAFEMIADGLVQPSKSPIILLRVSIMP